MLWAIRSPINRRGDCGWLIDFDGFAPYWTTDPAAAEIARVNLGTAARTALRVIAAGFDAAIVPAVIVPAAIVPAVSTPHSALRTPQ